MKPQLRSASLSLLAAICLTLAAVPAFAQNDLYDNGPVNGETSAWQINFGFAVSDEAKVANISRSNVKNNIVVWVEPNETPTSIGWGLGTTPFSTNIASGTSPVTITNSFVNQFGYDVDTVSFSMGTLSLSAGNYWVTLENATTADGAPVYWDENSGVGCTSPGCPSQAQENGVGTIPSETFTLEGSPAGSTPEPNTLALLGSGFVGLAAFLRCKSRA
ncbi:MAG: PEP-CTERM sorting domain-containing protein [Candidatus Korobacteraceae bacterium]